MYRYREANNLPLIILILGAAVLTERDNDFDLDDAPLYTWKLAGTQNAHLPSSFGNLCCVYTFYECIGMKAQIAFAFGSNPNGFYFRAQTTGETWGSWKHISFS